MRYTKFEIQNFKGIKEATINLGRTPTARVFTLVGLNESGKTTVLEAIHSFAPDSSTDTVIGQTTGIEERRREAVPRSKISDFDGRVSIKATLKLDGNDKNALIDMAARAGIVIDPEALEDEVYYERYSEYCSGDLKGNYYDTNYAPRVKTGRQTKFRAPNESEEGKLLEQFRLMMPSIAYFPTFVFDFPERIYLSKNRTGVKNSFYRDLFQDILDYGGRGHTIADHIVNRVQKAEYQLDFVGFLPVFTKSNEKQQVSQVVDHAARTVTKMVFSKWNEIFGETTGNKEIIVDWDVEQGQRWEETSKSYVDTNEHDVFVQFSVKDGADRFSISTRSLGFRWFFSFLLFTQFRAARNDQKPLLFLLDEPASNLHSSAQQKLIESFPEIAQDEHMLIYSTHSHYMIEPNWLEQAFIVQNKPLADTKEMMDSAILDDASVDVKVTPYRNFVGQNGSALSFFQPIADRLNVVPSKFDIDRAGILLEGKSDYYILEYFRRTYSVSGLRLYPALGSGTLDALIALLRGWGQPVRVVLDSDKAGKENEARYKAKFILNDDEIATLDRFDFAAIEVESFFSEEDLEKVASFSGKSQVKKKDLLRIFQEALAGNKKIPITTKTVNRIKLLLDKLAEFQKD